MPKRSKSLKNHNRNHNKNKNVINIKINTTEKTKRRRSGGGGVKKPNQPPVFVSPVITVAPSYPQYPQYQPPVQTSVPLPIPSNVQAAEPVSVPVAEPRTVGGAMRDPHGFKNDVLRLHSTDNSINNDNISVRDDDTISLPSMHNFFDDEPPIGNHTNINTQHNIPSHNDEVKEDTQHQAVQPTRGRGRGRGGRPPLTAEQKAANALRRAEDKNIVSEVRKWQSPKPHHNIVKKHDDDSYGL